MAGTGVCHKQGGGCGTAVTTLTGGAVQRCQRKTGKNQEVKYWFHGSMVYELNPIDLKKLDGINIPEKLQP